MKCGPAISSSSSTPTGPLPNSARFVGYAFAEGWARYAEEMMWESGLRNSDPETHIGQLLKSLLSNHP